MACPQEINVEEKRNEKQTKYRQSAFELRERKVGYNIIMIPLMIGTLGRGKRDNTVDRGDFWKR